MKYDAVVVGAGIIGAACAAELSDRGMKTLVIDPAAPGTGTTAACMGHVVVMDDSPAQIALSKYSSELWEDLVKKLPPSCENDLSGTLWVAEDEEEMKAVFEKEKLYSQHGIETEVLDKENLYKHEPNLREGLVGGLRVPGDRVVYPTNCTTYLLRDIEVKQEEVLEIKDNEVRLKGGESIQASNVILATGIHSSKLLSELPVKPRKGHLLITERYPNFAKHQIIELGYLKSAHSFDPESVAFNIQPRSTGQLLIGSSREFSGFDKSMNKKILKKMIDRACYYMPALSKVKSLRVWTGLRPSSHDGLPYIGKWPNIKGLYVCTGHEGLGITTSLGSAKLIGAAVFNEKAAIDSQPYEPQRVLDEQLSLQQ
jgi:D-hydroxyproline dehydrogenase subunit beta